MNTLNFYQTSGARSIIISLLYNIIEYWTFQVNKFNFTITSMPDSYFGRSVKSMVEGFWSTCVRINIEDS